MSQLQITGFEIIESLGQGGMASVWKARQLSLDRIVAIKVLSPRMARDVSDIERFLTEAKSAAKLKHSGIIQVYDVNAEDGLYYIVMEYVAGYTVGDWLRRKGVLSEEDALLVVDCVADALDYAWNKEGIIHCDIKPDNIIIDSDGTVKVADLGLARTITAMSARRDDEYVMGTPAYMSPEQARGDGDLDCRADIYSLGAMLYHLVTGKILFEGHPDDKIMEMQTGDATVEDPIETNPKLSKQLCWLIEKMLAKDRNGRPTDWVAVRSDISRVKKGRMPAGPVLPEGISTVARSKKRTVQDHSRTTSKLTQFKQEKHSVHVVAVLVLVVFVLGGIAGLLYMTSRKEPPPPPPTLPGRRVTNTIPPATVPTQPKRDPAEQAAMEMFDFAQKWAREHKDNFNEAVSRFEKVARETKGTKYSLMAEDEIRKLTLAREEEYEMVIRSLKSEVRPLIKSQDFEKAAELISNYSGKYASETESKRILLSEDIRRMRKALDEGKKKAEAQVEQKMKEFLGRLVTKLLNESMIAAYNELLDSSKDPDLSGKESDFSELKRLFENLMAIDSKIVDSFSSSIGQEITVSLNSGPLTVTVSEISAGKVICIEKLAARGSATRQIDFDASSLTPGERLKRMGQDSNPEVALAKGLMALSSKAYGHAKRYFGSTSPILSERLIAVVDDAEKKLVDEDAERALASLLRVLGYNVGPFDKEAWLKVLADKAIPLPQQRKAVEMVEKYRKDFMDTKFVTDAEDILKAITNQ
ncbi:MAG: hypothetical protein A2283_23135 [Lentisphaerae bacterium RIFOXYA12_FULL_48_11]|nr:MAG: hypothetical protein A2283_23135 [Lentisphaerae bacterium RIFOXYA12_FULL_48_11]